MWSFYQAAKAMVVLRPDDDRLAMMVDELRDCVAASQAPTRKPAVRVEGEKGGPKP